ncbi:hypothetical protein Back11_54870 [Paenibacillus baekrokdamisoli]|uniref:Uncharacterized protein n=1 Tax=Paenibacillus baekrokdamisoli TaxID=1712516 RepID=A0A3G9J0S1_9BACL|nr:DUF2971 domain-containing protein [Paenibacillus baekrokdamisoli]MBB3071876.1 hypothetical protein [Paenibacillus baekrokdamisoli]BBH24142.1 hypothetical protein Back11_54870 [Paenibacillus baekrokdamisoli]
MNKYRNSDDFLDQIESGTLYHYTSASGLLGIISNECLWVSKSNYLNDISETKYINELIVDAGRELNLSSNVMYMIMSEKAYIEYGSNGDVNGQNYYILSLTVNPDSLTLWSNYSSYYGYNIGFEGGALREILEKSPMNVDGRVIYDRDAQIELIRKEIEKYRVEIDDFIVDESEENREKLKIGIDILVVIFMLFGMFF